MSGWRQQKVRPKDGLQTFVRCFAIPAIRRCFQRAERRDDFRQPDAHLAVRAH